MKNHGQGNKINDYESFPFSLCEHDELTFIAQGAPVSIEKSKDC